MFQVRIHGRGGQGVVSAAEMLSLAAFAEGRHAQAFPSFGSERMGAPVTAFCRMHDREIRLREPVMEPDALIIQDPTLLHQVDVFSGVPRSGYILINSSRTLAELGLADYLRLFPPDHVCTVPASEIALAHSGRPLPNAALLGGFSALTRELTLQSVSAAIRKKFKEHVATNNVAAAEAAYAAVTDQLEASRAETG
ncbi:MAG TPA: 2-oxoacid:acceptor oxidoreductase family protein [Burkholderiales bacterium]|nr:2-oxoacid:acceptor oxidoreductase family protein [Burkholderiales bacterium]